MAGSIRSRGRGTWEVAYEAGRDPVTQKRLRRTFNVKGSKRDAEKRLTEVLSQRDRGIDLSPDKITVAEYLERWLRDYVDARTAPSTSQRYRAAITRHISPHIGSMQLARVRPMHIQGMHSLCRQEGLSAQTIVHHHRILREALSHAVQWQLLVGNPADAVRPPRPAKTEMKCLDEDGIQALQRASEGHPFEVLVYLALHTGARSGELAGLRWSDVDLDVGGMSIVRTAQRLTGLGVVFGPTKWHRAGRPVLLSPQAVARLREHRERQLLQRLAIGAAYQDADLVFAQALGQPYSPGQVSKTFALLLRRAGLPKIRFHDLRHTAATVLFAARVHPKAVSERLGHATVSLTLDRYSHVLPTIQGDAALAMDNALDRGRNDVS
jgi:integrase